MPKPMTNKKRNEGVARKARKGETTNVRVSGSGAVTGHRPSSRRPHNAVSGDMHKGREKG